MLTWNTTSLNNHVLHTASVSETDDQYIRRAIETCTDKAVSLLKNNIQDDSLYLLFEWDIGTSTLTIVTTDATKTHDAPEIIKCNFTEVADKLDKAAADYADSIKFWLHDYLTTCTAFFHYSLVAIFHSSTRNNTELL
jgi:hypothetical protein